MTRPMITVGISFLAATFVASFFNEVWVIACYIGILLFLFALLLRRKKVNNRASLVIAIAVAMVIGVTGYWVKAKFEYQPILQLDNQTATVTGVVTRQYQNEKGTPVYEINVKKVEGHRIPKFQTKLYSYTSLDANNYDTVKIKVDFHKITGTSSFDAQTVNQAKELYIIGYAKGEPIAIQPPEIRPPTYYLQQLNDTLCEKADQFLQQPTSAIVKAMLLGRQDDIEPIIQRTLSRAGIIHIISISGMHISFLAGFLFLLLKLFRIPNCVNSLISIIVIWMFVALVNFQIATVRSAIMVTILLAGNLFGRPPDHVNSLFFSGILIVLLNPFAVLSISFQLTFLATLGVLLCVKPMKNWIQSKWGVRNRIVVSLIESIACTIGATLFILPVLAITFGGVSIVSPIANLVAVPLTPIIMVSSIALFLTSFIPFLLPITKLLADWIDLLNTILLESAAFLQKWSYAYIGMNYRIVKLWLVISAIGILVVVFLCWLKKREDRKSILLKCVGFSLFSLIGILMNCSMQERQDLKVTTIGSYDTQAIVMTYQKKATVITFETDGYICNSVVDYLDSKNIKEVESLILFQDNTKKKQDIAFLLNTKQVHTVMVRPENQLIHYLERNLLNKSKKLLLDKNYRVQADKSMRYEVVVNDKTYTVLVSVGNGKIGITNSEQVAQRTPVKILYISQKNIQRIEQFSSKYVILLDKYEKRPKPINKTVLDAYENSIELTIKKNGTYQLRK